MTRGRGPGTVLRVALDPRAALLTGRVAVVTGAAIGIGEATAIALARFGADVAVCDRDAENLETTAEAIRAAGRRALTGVFDVRDDDRVAAFCQEIARAFGRADVLVNNAGGTFRAAFLETRPRGQEALIGENFTSVASFVRAVVPLVPRQGGSIVNITSIEAHRAGPEYAIYSAQKAAVANLTMSLALELGARRIRVNCIAPDLIMTPGEAGMGERDLRTQPPRTPLPRHGHPDDVAATVVFLAGDMARFVTGTTIQVDGGNAAAGGST